MKTQSKINLKNRSLWLLIVGLLLIGIPSLLDKVTPINTDISDFIIGIGASLVLASLYFFSKNKMDYSQK